MCGSGFCFFVFFLFLSVQQELHRWTPPPHCSFCSSALHLLPTSDRHFYFEVTTVLLHVCVWVSVCVCAHGWSAVQFVPLHSTNVFLLQSLCNRLVDSGSGKNILWVASWSLWEIRLCSVVISTWTKPRLPRLITAEPEPCRLKDLSLSFTFLFH